MTVRGASDCEYLAWDSEFFGVGIGRLRPERLDPDVMAATTRWVAEHRVDCVYVLCDPEHHPSLVLAHRHALQPTDVRVALELQPAIAVDRPDWAGTVRPARPADVPALRAMAAANHRHSRFYYDARFSHARCDELFATWMEKSCSGYADQVLVGVDRDEITGYVTLHLDADGGGRVGLFGTSPIARGTGCARAVMCEAVRWLRDSRVERITVVTQARNVAALRFYERRGFVIANVRLWYHWWPGAAGAA